MMPNDELAVEWACTRLINHYANLNDAGRWEDLVALYTNDGSMTRPSAPELAIVGKPALLASFRARPPRASRHVCANIVVTVESATAACAKSIILLFTGTLDTAGGLPIRDPEPPLVGRYDDRFVLTDAGWRFAERRGSPCFR